MSTSILNPVTLGMTGIEVSPVAFGTWQLGGEWGQFDEDEGIAAIRRARELGINLFDTAQGYGFGASERLLGRALRDDFDNRREEVVVATKGGLRMTEEGLVRDASPAWLRSGVQDSLRALEIDYIDIYQVHWPDPKVPFSETATALQELVDEGKIRHVGVSNFDTAQIAELARTRPVETVQPPYHLFRRDIEAELLPYARERDIGVLVYGPLMKGTTMTRKDKILNRRKLSALIAAGAIAIGGGGYGIVSATASTGSATAVTASSPSTGAGVATTASSASGHRVPGKGGSNARSGPAAGGSIGKVTSVLTSGFVLSTSGGQKVTVKETSSTTYEQGTSSALSSAVTKGKTALVLGTTDSTTITATQVIVGPTNVPESSSKVIAFKRGAPSTSKQAGQIPASYKQGTGTIVSGATANEATKAALAAYPGGIVDRVVKLSNGEYEVHNIGVNWPHHIFINQDFKVLGAD
jgi:aryl-alcohol dehydrogenase-like predicted oxidoreductase